MFRLFFSRVQNNVGPNGFPLSLPYGLITCQPDRKNCICESRPSCIEVFSLYRINWNPVFAYFVFGRKEGRTSAIFNFNPENVGIFGGGGAYSLYTISLTTPVGPLGQPCSGQILISIPTIAPVAKKSEFFRR